MIQNSCLFWLVPQQLCQINICFVTCALLVDYISVSTCRVPVLLIQVMIYLIDHMLPESYFANNLRALSVDMAVFRELLNLQLPRLSRHLDHLQVAARDHTTGRFSTPVWRAFCPQILIFVLEVLCCSEIIRSYILNAVYT